MKKYLTVLIATLLISLLLFPVLLIKQPTIDTKLFSVKVSIGGNTEKISFWELDKGKYYVFLPSGAELSAASMCFETQVPVYIDGERKYTGDTCAEFELNTSYEFSYECSGKPHSGELVFMQSANIASLYIDTESGNMDYIHNKKGNKESGKLCAYNNDGTIALKANVESIAGRGNTTWDYYDKKSYSLDLSKEVDLLGMGAANRWILVANAGDPSNMRNKIVYEFAEIMKLSYSPDSRWVDLYLNGEYAGLYLLCERNEVNTNRIDISKENTTLLSWEDESNLEAKNQTYITTNSGKAYRVHYPKVPTNELMEKISYKCQTFENALFSDSGIDSLTGKSWLDMIDLESWAKKYLLEEIMGNLDGYMVSHYCYWDGLDDDGRFYAGPVWDYDHAMGNDTNKYYSVTNPQAFVVGRTKNNSFDKGYIPAFLQKQEFTDMTKQLFKDEFLPELNEFLEEKLPEYIAETEFAFKMNKVRWFNDGKVGTLQEEANQIYTYITDHTEFLYSAWVEGEKYCKVSITGLPNNVFYTVLSGECLEELPEISDTSWGVFKGLYYCDNDKPFDITKPITEDTELYAKWADSDTNKADDLIKLIPAIVITVLFVVIFVVDLKRNRKSGVTKYDRA